MWILVSKFRWSHSHLFTVVDPLLDDRHRILMRFRNSGSIIPLFLANTLFIIKEDALRSGQKGSPGTYRKNSLNFHH